MKLVALALAVLVSGGCYASMHVTCKGKGVITVNAMVYGGTISGDCGEGFEYSRESEKYSKSEATPPATK